MPGFEFFGDLERKEVNDVLDSGSFNCVMVLTKARNHFGRPFRIEQQVLSE